VTRPDTVEVARVALALGRRAYGYQLRGVETLSTPTGSRPYPRVAVVLAPRQTGKTTTVGLDLSLARMRRFPGFAASYTCQTGHDTSERFAAPGGWLDVVEGSRLARRVRTRRSAGTERITYRGRGAASWLAAFPPVPGKLRGKQRDLVIVDECQELDQVGADLVADIMPTGDTRPLAQLILTGTAGTGPGWWQTIVDEARAGRYALVEVGTWPDDADPDDESVWAAWHPGVRAGLTTLDNLRNARSILGADRFAREYGNRWGTLTGSGERPLPLDEWRALGSPRSTGKGARWVGAGFDVTPNRETAALVTASDSGRVRLRWEGPPDELAAACRRYAPRSPVTAPPGQVGTVEALRRAGVNARTLSGREYRAACQGLRDAVAAGTLSHDVQTPLDTAVDGAARSWAGDSWVFSARRSGVVIAPVVAAACAVYAVATRRVPRVAAGSGSRT
jgi:hypothetical protein